MLLERREEERKPEPELVVKDEGVERERAVRFRNSTYL